MKIYLYYRTFTVFLFAATFSGCDWEWCRKPENATVAHNRIIQYYEQGCFAREVEKVVDSGKDVFKNGPSHDRQVILFDIDETILSDYCNIKSIQFGYVPKLSHTWIMKASAPAIPAMKDFYEYLVKKGYKIIFLTGRHHDEYDATFRNLHQQGFTSFEKLIVRPAESRHLTATEYKTAMRTKLVAEGWEIIGAVGDQWSDLQGAHVGRVVKVPNYMYEIR